MSAALDVRSTGSGEGVPARWLHAGVRVLIVVAVIGVAYHYSLGTLVQNLGVDSPLAYLGLVPFIALIMALARGAPAPSEPDIHDRQLDYIVGLPLVVGALLMSHTLPAHLSTMFWVWRVDLLSLPLFAAGTVCLVFGVRTLWRTRAAIAFLLLAWPLPYTTLLDRGLASFTNLTIAALRGAIHAVPVASWVSGPDGSLFAVQHAGSQFILSVASACSGANSMVGFILVGVAFVALVKGRRLLKTVWLLGGVALLWGLNLARILLIFAVGRRWGEHVAIDSFHPYIGLAFFNLGVATMILAMPLFRLRMALPEKLSAQAEAAEGTELRKRRARSARPGARIALLIVVLAAGGLGVENGRLVRYGLVASELGQPRLVGFSDAQGRPQGWTVSFANSFTTGLRFFGDRSSWRRFIYLNNEPGEAGPVKSSTSVIADVIDSYDLRSFSVYGVEACYNFHGYTIQDVATADIGGGIRANLITYYHPHLHSYWTTLYWHWPVADQGGKTRYERVALMMVDGAGDPQVAGATRPPARSVAKAVPSEQAAPTAQGARTRQFLIGFAQSVVRAQPGSGRPVASPNPTAQSKGVVAP